MKKGLISLVILIVIIVTGILIHDYYKYAPRLGGHGYYKDTIEELVYDSVKKAENGEYLITEESYRSDLLDIEFIITKEGFNRLTFDIPEKYRAYQDITPAYVDGLPEYFLYNTETEEWYGPFYRRLKKSLVREVLIDFGF